MAPRLHVGTNMQAGTNMCSCASQDVCTTLKTWNIYFVPERTSNGSIGVYGARSSRCGLRKDVALKLDDASFAA
jgi:hypothetical protein